MGICLNVLESPEVFLLAATLLALVLLVWAQLYASGQASKQPKNVHWVMGLFWTYLAMFFALAAVAALSLNANVCAKGFLVLSFLMTAVNILLALLLSFTLIWRPPEESLVGKSAQNKCWVFAWLALLFGLALISFSVVGKLGGLSSCWFRLGVVLAGVTILFVVGMILKNFCCCIRRCCTSLRWECWKVRRKWKKCWRKLLIAIFIAVVGLGFISFWVAGALKCCWSLIIGVLLFLAAVCFIFCKICKKKTKKESGKKDEMCVLFYYSCGKRKRVEENDKRKRAKRYKNP
jgi:hypothetical protein